MLWVNKDCFNETCDPSGRLKFLTFLDTDLSLVIDLETGDKTLMDTTNEPKFMLDLSSRGKYFESFVYIFLATEELDPDQRYCFISSICELIKDEEVCELDDYDIYYLTADIATSLMMATDFPDQQRILQLLAINTAIVINNLIYMDTMKNNGIYPIDQLEPIVSATPKEITNESKSN